MGKAFYESGGIAISRAIREDYIKNPKLCLECNRPLLPREDQKPSAVRKRNFAHKNAMLYIE
jgi:hypothetical protein